MSRIREVVARMAVDPEFADQVRSRPADVAQAYGLQPDEIDKLRGLADADAESGPATLGARLSKSGIGGGLLAGLLASAAETTSVDPTASAEGGDVSKAELFVFDPQPDPPGGPHVAEAALGGPDTQPVGDAADDGGIIIHYAPDPDAFGPEGGEVESPIPNDGDARGMIIHGMPEPGNNAEAEAKEIIINDMPDPGDGAHADAKGMIIHGQSDPNDAAYGVPDTKLDDAGPGDADDVAIIDDGDHPEATRSQAGPKLMPGAEKFANTIPPAESDSPFTI